MIILSRFFLILFVSIILQLLFVKESLTAQSYGNKGLGPITSRNQAPLLNLFYLMPATSTDTIGRKKSELRMDFDMSSISEYGSVLTSPLAYDMEIYRTSLNLTHGISDDKDLHIEIPMISFNGGHFDSAIKNFHDFFGLPNGGRYSVQDDHYAYFFSEDGNSLFDFPSRSFSISDINMDIKWKVLNESVYRPAFVLRAGVKLPTGDYKKGTGSDGYDYAFGISFSKSNKNFHFFGGIDGTVIEEPEPLEYLIDEDLLHFYLGAEYEVFNDKFSLLFQVEGQNTPFAYTGHETLDREVLELVLGIKGANLSESFLWQMSIREDLIFNSTVDFTLSFSAGTRF